VLRVEDKTFELLSKMYGEFTERFDEMGKEIKGLKNEVVRMENKLDANLQCSNKLNSYI
jgi:hypothetical protein